MKRLNNMEQTYLLADLHRCHTIPIVEVIDLETLNAFLSLSRSHLLPATQSVTGDDPA